MENQVLDDSILPKEFNLDKIEYAGFWIRLLASMIDGLILIPIYILIIYNFLSIKSLPLMLFLTLLSAIYKPLLEWKKSATFGKMALNIKVVDSSLNNISGEQAVTRYFPWIISILITLISDIMLFTDPAFYAINDWMQIGLSVQETTLGNISSIYSFIFLILVGWLIFDKRKQGIHDKAAKTYCIISK